MNTSPSIYLRNAGLGLRTLWVLAVAATLCTGALAQTSAARVMALAGAPKAIDAQGQERLLEKGSDVRAGERIVTAEGALVQLRLNDGGYMSVRPGTEMVIDRFVYDDKDASKSNFLVSLVRGGFRSITGLIGRTNPNAYQIRAGTATLGIRGTDHEPMMIPEGVPSMAKLGAPGLYDKVNDGETFIRNAGGLLALKRGEIGFSPINADRAPQFLRNVPEFYRTDIKVDARDPKDANDDSPDARKKGADAGDGMLRPSTAARRAASKNPDGTLVAPNTTLIAPTNTLIAPTTNTMVAPNTTLVAPTNTLVAPTNTIIAPTNTMIAPTNTMIAPTNTMIAPTNTMIAPTNTMIAPTNTMIAPTNTIVAPTNTFTAPTTAPVLRK